MPSIEDRIESAKIRTRYSVSRYSSSDEEHWITVHPKGVQDGDGIHVKVSSDGKIEENKTSHEKSPKPTPHPRSSENLLEKYPHGENGPTHHLLESYNPSEARDDHGKWTSGSDSSQGDKSYDDLDYEPIESPERKEGHGTFFRVHWTPEHKVSSKNAKSYPWGQYGNEEMMRRGYSSFESPGKLLKYFETRGEPAGARVVVYDGKHAAEQGHDDEELSIPTRGIASMSWEQFKSRFKKTDDSIDEYAKRIAMKHGSDADTATAIGNEAEKFRDELIRHPKKFVKHRHAFWNEESE